MRVTQAAQELAAQLLDCFAASFNTALELDWSILLLSDELFGFSRDHTPQEGLLAIPI